MEVRMNRAYFQHQREQGYILVVSLVLLLAMTLMGLGLLHVSLTEKQLVERSVVNQERIFEIAETCTQDAESWLAGQLQVGTPILPFSLPTTNFSSVLPLGVATAEELIQFNQYTYAYTVDRIGSAGGNDAGESAEYSGNAGGQGEANYRITCLAQRPAPEQSSLTIIRELTL
jgi:hypothetical protein|tara:strand:+ start:1036 stop:1554 length:519 start_codon:yes stop_codon:yes gene_type:complete